jgi:hypothetical protein
MYDAGKWLHRDAPIAIGTRHPVLMNRPARKQ